MAVVYHTTETRGMPGYRGGDTAPHYSYDAKRRKWWQHADVEDGYVGTMKGHTTGGHGNCKAIQVEIIAYSDRPSAVKYGGLWVGDFTDDHYADLIDFYRWCRHQYVIGNDIWGPPLPYPWQAGSSSPYRLGDAEWEEFSGLTAHGAVPRNTHWDTGVLDIERIAKEADVFGTWVEGWVRGQQEDMEGTRKRMVRLFNEEGMPPEEQTETNYWMGKINDETDPEWPGFYARREMEFWAQSSEGATT